MTEQEFAMEYARLGHAIQSGVAFEQEHGSTDGTPKHLRVGVNTSKCDQAALARLLISKGVITNDEHMQSVIDELKAEVARYEERIEKNHGIKITLA